MRIKLELPEDIAHGLECKWKDLPRAALESLALIQYPQPAKPTTYLNAWRDVIAF